MFSPFKKGEVFKDHFDAGVYVCAKCGNPLFERKKLILLTIMSAPSQEGPENVNTRDQEIWKDVI